MADLPAPKPFYRSRLFWLGLPGLVFLLWTWRKSNLTSIHVTYVPVRGSIESWQMESVSGGLRWWHRWSNLNPGPEWSPPPPYSVWTREVGPDHRRWFKRPVWRKDSSSDNGQTRYQFHSLPYWLLTGCYTSAWLGSVALWQRRKTRLLKASSAVPPP